MIYPYPCFHSFIEHIVELGIILDPLWEERFFLLNIKINIDRHGYPRIWNNKLNRYELLHRIVINALDKEEVDHINRDPSDCRISNLRIVSHLKNIWNKKSAGVSQDSSTYLWVSQIYVNGIRYRRKFKDKVEAIKWRKQLEIDHYGRLLPED